MVQPVRILLVEDAANQRRALTEISEAEGFAVVACRTTEEALARMAHERFVMLIVDVQLPSMDGMHLLDRVRAINPATRIIIHTAHGPFALAKDAVSLGVSALIKKGGDPTEFVCALHRAHAQYLQVYATALEAQVTEQTTALQQSETRYRTLFERAQESERFARSTLDALSAHLCVLDETGTILTVNAAWREYLARNSSGPARAAEGINYLTVCDATTGEFAEQAATFAAGIRTVLTGERESFACEYYCPAPMHPGWFSGHVTKFTGEGPVRVVIAHEDITEQKKAETALRESEARFRATFEQSASGMAHVGLDGRFLLVNQKLCDILGYSRDELQQSFCQDLTHPDDRATVEKETQRVLTGEMTAFGFEKRGIRKDGTLVSVNQRRTLVRAADGTPLYFVDVIEDISVRKQIEAEQARLIAILENTSDFVVTTTVDGRGVYMNRAGRELLGVTSDADLREWKGTTAYAEQSRELVFRQGIPTALRIGIWFGEAAAVSRSGEEIPVSQVIIAHKDEKGRAQYLSVIARDISEQKKAAETLQILSHRVLNAQEQERRHLARELHDELGQVLSALKMTLQNGQRRPANLTLRVEESVAMVQTALEQVRTLSRNLRPPMLDDLGLVAALRWYVNQQAQRMGVEVQLTAEVPEQRFSLEVETVCFRVMQEALTNIMRHAQAQHIWVELRYREGRLQLLVQDDGVGFDVEAASAQTAHGISSGLLGMRERAQLVGGQVHVTSIHGVGTEVRAVFPAAPDRMQPMHEE